MKNKALLTLFNQIRNKPFAAYSFSLYLFTRQLYDRCRKDGITDLYFLAREGQFLKRLFEIYLSQSPVDPDLKLHYVYISRKACVSARLDHLDQENFLPYRCYSALSIRAFLASLNFSQEEADEITALTGLDASKRIESFFDSSPWKILRNNERFRELYDAHRIQAARCFDAYLASTGYLTAEAPALVDVGWSGTMQDQLVRGGYRQTTIGYYLGLSGVADESEDNRKTGLLSDCRKGRNPYLYSYNNYEYICVADHGSTAGYDEAGKPVLQDDDDLRLYREVFRPIQKDIETAFIEICGALKNEAVEESDFQSLHARMLLRLSRQEKEIINAAVRSHPDNFVDTSAKKSLRLLPYYGKRLLYLIDFAYLK